ncbi:MAG: 23S rRNA (guanosine(2251)-2'-O)-methyltransferase RlmB [Bacillota bacterium]|nr:MAG: 23S rRNA (guanosine(2251)-2'-O)-methyltransferase RlmB [Bacillota bacterium]
MKTEGRNAVNELLKTDVKIEKLLVENSLRDAESRAIVAKAKEKGVRIQFADKAGLDRECQNRKHQGFIAYTPDYRYADEDELLSDAEQKDGFYVVLDGITDPHNLGSIIRVCECAGVDGLLFADRRSAGVTETVMRVSEGAANHLKIARTGNVNDLLDDFKNRGYWVTGAELGGENIYGVDFSGKCVLVVGGEDTGIRRLTQEKCDRLAEIPMYGKVNSLNASVACGVAVFEAMRRRRGF